MQKSVQMQNADEKSKWPEQKFKLSFAIAKDNLNTALDYIWWLGCPRLYTCLKYKAIHVYSTTVQGYPCFHRDKFFYIQFLIFSDQIVDIF